MSLDFLRQSIVKALEDAATERTNRAINMRANIGIPADQYAMMQAQTLAEAFALQQAARIVNAEYKKMTDPPKEAPANDEKPQQQNRPHYG